MIYFIGAGPGAADLITVKGKDYWKGRPLYLCRFFG